MQSHEVRHESSCYVGNIDENVQESVLWELFIQAGPVTSVYLPKDRLTNVHQGFAFIEMQTEEDADYAIKILNMIKLFNKPIKVNRASAHQKDVDVGANIFVGNLDPNVDEKTLYDVFSAFGIILAPPKIMKDPVTNESKGYAFINFATFESSDAAIEAMNGQFLENKPITLQYAFKKEARGERHGSIAERLLASKNPNVPTTGIQPNQMFNDNPNQIVEGMQNGDISELPQQVVDPNMQASLMFQMPFPYMQESMAGMSVMPNMMPILPSVMPSIFPTIPGMPNQVSESSVPPPSAIPPPPPPILDQPVNPIGDMPMFPAMMPMQDQSQQILPPPPPIDPVLPPPPMLPEEIIQQNNNEEPILPPPPRTK